MNYFIHTFGCKSNQYESQAIREGLDAAGFRGVGSPAAASVFVINTCGVTGRAVASCRNAIRRAVRENPGLLVVITGCGVDLGETWPELSREPLIIPNAQKYGVAARVRARLENEPAGECAPDPFKLRISNFAGHTRAFLKVQDGCDNFCAYCAVPFARGKPRSRPIADILDEARRLVDAGYRELVLTGINIGVYDFGGRRFPDLVAALADVSGLERLRLGSVEPPQVDEALVQAMRGNGRICPHLHLPLQSGSDRMLEAMGRRYDSRAFLEKVAMLRERLAAPAITTDIIVGFPGEEERDYRDSREVCEQAGFSRLHVFLFSARAGTAAASMKSTVPNRVVGERKNDLIRLGEALAERYARECVGLGERVIVERGGAGLGDRYVKIRVSPPPPAGAVVGVVVTSAEGGELTGARLEAGHDFPDVACEKTPAD